MAHVEHVEGAADVDDAVARGRLPRGGELRDAPGARQQLHRRRGPELGPGLRPAASAGLERRRGNLCCKQVPGRTEKLCVVSYCSTSRIIGEIRQRHETIMAQRAHLANGRAACNCPSAVPLRAAISPSNNAEQRKTQGRNDEGAVAEIEQPATARTSRMTQPSAVHKLQSTTISTEEVFVTRISERKALFGRA